MKAVVLLLCLAVGASSLKCLICNSKKDKGCGHGSDADKKWVRECNTTEPEFKSQLPTLPTNKTYTLCRKIVSTVDFEVNENKAEERIKRACGWDDEEEKYRNECYYRGGLGGRSTVCSCQTDDCNGSTTLGLSTATAILAVITVLKSISCF